MRIDVLRKLQNPLTLSAHRDRMRRWRSHQHASAAIRTGAERASLVVCRHPRNASRVARACTHHPGHKIKDCCCGALVACSGFDPAAHVGHILCPGALPAPCSGLKKNPHLKQTCVLACSISGRGWWPST